MKHQDQDGLKRKQFAFKAESVDDAGKFKGYGSVFGVVDSYREVVDKGAFDESLKEWRATGDPLPALWQHSSSQPVGGYDVLAEDAHGLKCEGFLMLDELPLARQAHALMKRKIVRGLSIGYYVEDWVYNEKEQLLHLKKLALKEISIVTFGANPDALIDDVKRRDEKLFSGGRVPSLSEFERWLCETAGCTKAQATLIASKGLRVMQKQGEPGSGDEMEALFNAMKQFQV